MTVKSGFFNSVNKDRTYSAEDMTRPYELLVSNGVFATPQGTPSTYLQVYAGSGMTVTVKAGRGLFKDKWFINDSDIALTLDDAEVTLTRIDSIIVKIDTSETVREGTIEIKKGTPSSEASAPVMERSEDVYEYRLADITIKPGVTEITQANITDMRGSSDCPWVTSLLQQVDTSTLLAQWQDAYNTQYDTFGTEFEEWFATIKEALATATLIRSYESVYTTTTQDETTIPINITQYNKELDILQVYINGLMLIKGTEYTITDNTSIELTNGPDIGTPVSFVVYKSIDGSEAETVVQQVYDLQNQVTTLETEVQDILDANQMPALWSGASFMDETADITISKALSECAHGWVLVWSDYDDSTSSSNNYDVVTTVIPKKNAFGGTWNSSSLLCTIPTALNDDGTYTMCVKKLYIYDSHIAGHVANGVSGAPRDVVLRVVYEY